MLGKQGVRLFIDRTPKFGFREFLRCEAFRKQGVKFIGRPRESWYSALFDGSQGSFNNFLDGLVSTPTHDGLNSLFLFWREMNGHGLLAPGVRGLSANLRVRESFP
jgi:hypothetical protein